MLRTCNMELKYLNNLPEVYQKLILMSYEKNHEVRGENMAYYIRPIESGDAKGINALRRMPGVFENVLGIPSERIKRSEDDILNLDDNVHEFVAVVKEATGSEMVVGNISLKIFSNPRLRHSGSIDLVMILKIIRVNRLVQS